MGKCCELAYPTLPWDPSIINILYDKNVCKNKWELVK